MGNEKIRIMLVDDHAVVRSGLRRMMDKHADMLVIAEADSGEAAYQIYAEHLPDILVMDISMPGMGGLEATRRILVRFPSARILIFSMHENAAFATQAIRAGAKGYVAKADAPEDLLVAIRDLARGKNWVSPSVAQKVAMQSMLGEENPLQQLSAREFEVFRLLADGRTSEEIGEMLKISQKTVANYHTLVKQRLGVNSSVELLRLAIRHGVVES